MVSRKIPSLLTRITVVVALVCTCAVCTADDTLPAKMTAAEAISIALRTNANLKQAQEKVLTSLSHVRTAGIKSYFGIGSRTGLDRTDGDSALSGSVFGDVTYTSLSGTEASLNLAPFGTGEDRGSVSAKIQHPLMKGKGALSRKANLLADAQSGASIEEKQLYLIRQSVTLGVINAYYRAVLAKEQVKVQEEAVSIAEEVAEDARKREEAGLIAGIDVSRSLIRVAQTKDDLNRQRRVEREAMDMLMLAIGAGVGETPELTDAIPETVPQTVGLAEAVKTALDNRSELSISDEQISSQMRKLAVSEDDLRPSLNLVAALDSTNDDRGLLSTSFIETGSFRAGLELRFPLDRRITIEQRDTAEREIDVLNSMRILRMESIAEQVRRAHRSVERAQTSLDILTQSMKVTQDSLQLAKRMVEEGVGYSNREVLDAQEALTRVQGGILAAKADLFLSGVELQYAMGEDLTTMERQ